MNIEHPDLIFDTIDSGIIILDNELNIKYWNKWLEFRSDLFKKKVLNTKLSKLFPNIKEKTLKRKIKTTLALNSISYFNVESNQYLIEIPLSNVTEKLYQYMQQRVSIVPYDIEKKYVCLFIYDQTSQSEINYRLNEYKIQIETHNKTLQSIMDTNEHMLIVSNGKDLTFANKSFLKFTGHSTIEDFFLEYSYLYEIFINNKNYQYNGIQNKDISFCHYLLSLESKKRIVMVINKSTQEQHLFYLSLSILDSKIKSYLWNFTDITQIELDKQDMEYKIYHDPLTKIYNRAKIDEVIKIEVHRFKRYNEPFCFSIIDIDHFKKFNDTYGHQIGDEVLISLAQICNNATRTTDTFARWGGEEFVLIHVNTKLENSIIAIEKLKSAINNIEHKIAGKITASFGITQMKDGDTVQSLFQRADKALYKAKENGRNRYELLL